MIKIEQLTNRLNTELNNNSNGFVFNIFTDTGKFKKCLKKGNTVTEYINALSTVVSSEVVSTNNGTLVGTMTTRTEFIVRCKDHEEDIYRHIISENNEEPPTLIKYGNETFMSQIRGVLDSYVAETKFFTLEETEDGKSFDVSVAFSFTSTGQREIKPIVGDSMTFIIYGYYNIIESGENSRRYELWLDGERVPFSAMTPRRAPTQEQDVYADTKDGSVKATISNTVFGLSLECPSFVGEFSKAIKNYILNGERNKAHLLRLNMNGVESSHLVFFGECSTTAKGILNAGQYISFMDAISDYDLIYFDSPNLSILPIDEEKTLTFPDLPEKTVVYDSISGETKIVSGKVTFPYEGEVYYVVMDKKPIDGAI
jgi:hypothetical protein